MTDLPYVPMNWKSRDTITRRVLDVIDAALPEGKQNEAIKHLIKETTRQYFDGIFMGMLEYLSNLEVEPMTTVSGHDGYYMEAIWKAYTRRVKDIRDDIAEKTKD